MRNDGGRQRIDLSAGAFVTCIHWGAFAAALRRISMVAKVGLMLSISSISRANFMALSYSCLCAHICHNSGERPKHEHGHESHDI